MNRSACSGLSEISLQIHQNLQAGKDEFSYMYHSPTRKRSFWEAVHDLDGPLQVLDMGTGDAHAESQVARYGLEFMDTNVVAVDIDERVAPNLLASAAELPFRSESFDLVFLESVLEHMRFQDVPAAFEEARRIIVPGGVIAGWVPFCYPYHGGGVMRDDLRFTSVGVERLLNPFTDMVIEACGGPLSVQLVHTPKLPTGAMKRFIEPIETRLRDYLPDKHREALPSVGFRFHARAPD